MNTRAGLASRNEADKVLGLNLVVSHVMVHLLSCQDILKKPSAGTRANEGVSCEVCHSLTGSTEDLPFNFSR